MKSSRIQLAFSEHGLCDTYTPSASRVAKIRAFFAAQKRSKILDVGCANGVVLSPLLNQHEIHGVDVSEVFVSQAKANGIPAKVCDLDSDPLPFESASFDAMLCAETIEHVVDTDWLLSEINRVLRPGGTLVLTIPNVRTVTGILMMLLADLPPMYAARYRAPHFRDFTLKTTKEALKNNGFKFVKANGIAFFFPGLGEFGSAIAQYFPSWSSTALIIARKESNVAYDLSASVRSTVIGYLKGSVTDKPGAATESA